MFRLGAIMLLTAPLGVFFSLKRGSTSAGCKSALKTLYPPPLAIHILKALDVLFLHTPARYSSHRPTPTARGASEGTPGLSPSAVAHIFNFFQLLSRL